MKTLHLAIIIVVIAGGIVTVTIIQIPHDAKVIINASGGRPLDLIFHVKELDMRTQTIVNPNFPIILESGKNATLKIEIESHVPHPLSLQLRVFNNVGNNYDLAFAHVKFNGDASGLPNGLTVSFSSDVITVDANGNDQDALTFTAGQNVKTGNY
ncbi:MAG: hypothetical protein KGH99_08195, partial [Thaumarchaeota archaeon]|nr:hypothetical protein [Nitrososphaerota archaeon]